MSGTATRAIVVAVLLAGMLGWLHALGVGLPLLLLLGLVISIVTLVVPWLGVRWLEDAVLWVRGLYWQREQGRFHSFRGVPMHIDDDGRHCWLLGEDFQQALGTRDAEAVLAARHAGCWQRDGEGQLMLRVDAVVQHLATMPGRNDVRVQRLRRFLERDVLYPAAQRRTRKTA